MRRKIVRKTKPSTAQDDKKLQGALKKLNVQPIQGVEEVNMFREDGNVLHFSTPKGTSRVLVFICYFLRSIVLRVYRGGTLGSTCVTPLACVYICATVAEELIPFFVQCTRR